MTAFDHPAAGVAVTLPNIVNVFIALFKDTTWSFHRRHFRFPAHRRGGARRSQKWASPITSLNRLCLCRIVLLCLLLCHVALRAARRSAPGAPLGGDGAMMDKRPDDSRAETPRDEVAVEIIALNKWSANSTCCATSI